MTVRAGERLTDVNLMVAGQGGDGSLTVITLLGNLLARSGFHLYLARNVASRIKGGHAAAMLRGSLVPRGGIGDRVDVFMAFDAEAIVKGAGRLAPDAIVVFDSSGGPPPQGYLPEGATLLEVPFARLAVRDLRRDLFKNSFGFGVLTRLLSVSDEEAATVLEARFARRPELVAANLRALRAGFAYADEHGIGEGDGPRALGRQERDERIFISGNEALAYGFLVAGGRFYVGYPITPASEILAWLARHLPAFDGIAVQAEDELAAVNMALGAAMTGARTMVATSGPGIALMQEGIGHAGAAEIPLVVVDCQRGGPSTGMPTKPEQSDLGMLVHGGNGDFPRIVLAPGDPTDCFELGVLATNLAQRFQGPVYVALDQAVSQDSMTVPPFDPATVTVTAPKRLDAAAVATLGAYRRYEVTPDGISPWVVPGTPGGMSLVTGNEHDEWGLVSTEPANRIAQVDKRARKVATLRGDLPPGRHFGNPDATVGVVGFGMETGVMRETVERLAAAGSPVAGLQLRTLFPVLDETLAFIAAHDRTVVVEHNAEGQLRDLLVAAGAPADRLRSILRYDGIPHRPGELATRVREETA